MNGTKRRPSSSGSTAAVVGAECVDGEMEVVRTGAVEPVTSAKMMVCDLPDHCRRQRDAAGAEEARVVGVLLATTHPGEPRGSVS
jgi:hypothetical protein